MNIFHFRKEFPASDIFSYQELFGGNFFHSLYCDKKKKKRKQQLAKKQKPSKLWQTFSINKKEAKSLLQGLQNTIS